MKFKNFQKGNLNEKLKLGKLKFFEMARGGEDDVSKNLFEKLEFLFQYYR